jgi:hypothetical protein
MAGGAPYTNSIPDTTSTTAKGERGDAHEIKRLADLAFRLPDRGDSSVNTFGVPTLPFLD